MGLFQCAFRLVRNFVIVFLTVALIPGIPPKTHFDLEPFTVPRPQSLTGPLAKNSYLNNAEHLYEGRIIGPEALLSRGDDIYASITTDIVKLTKTHVTHLVKFGRPCEKAFDEETCGRVLGIRFDTISNSIIAADAYYGIWQVDLDTYKKTQLLSPETVFGGKIPRKAKFFNSVVVSKSGDIFWTDSSSDYNRVNGLMTLFANPSGRLFHYDRKSKVNRVLLDNLYFANGLVLSPNEDFLLVAETHALRITRYYLKGPKAGTSDVFVDRLPGTPDNLNDDQNGIWVPCSVQLSEEEPGLWLSMTQLPIVRRFILRLVYLLEMPLEAINNFQPNQYTKALLTYLGSFESFGPFMTKSSIVIRLDWSGKIVGSLQGQDESITAIADVLEKNGHLYLGSYKNPFLGRVKLPEIFSSAGNQKSPPKLTTTTTTTTTTQKPSTTTTTPKPATTTTPKPVTTTTTTTSTPKPTTPKTTQKATTTTTPKPTTTTTTTPKPTTTTTTTPKPATTTTTKTPTTQKPPSTTTTPTTTTPEPTKNPIPVHEVRDNDIPSPPPEKLRVIKRGGEQSEL